MSKKIIIGVDDDQDILDLISVVVVNSGYRFIGVSSGHECIDVLATANPILIFLDVEMPSMNGFETLKEIRSLFPNLSAPVAFLTAHRSQKYLEQALELEGTSFILKPFDPQRLIQRIQDLVEGNKNE